MRNSVLIRWMSSRVILLVRDAVASRQSMDEAVPHTRWVIRYNVNLRPL